MEQDYHYIRNPEADPLSVEGTKTGQLLHLVAKTTTMEGYKPLHDCCVAELSIRGISDREIANQDYLGGKR